MSEDLAKRFHEAYERLAPQFGYETREASAKPWSEVPENNKRLMIAVASEIQSQRGEPCCGYQEVLVEMLEESKCPHSCTDGLQRYSPLGPLEACHWCTKRKALLEQVRKMG